VIFSPDTATLSVYPVPTRAFQVFWSFLPEARLAVDEMGRFVRDAAKDTAGQAGQAG
jgi:hypothetical protein